MTIDEFLALPPESRRTLVKHRVHDLLFGGPVPAKELAFNLGRDYRRLCKCAEEAEDSHLPLHELIALTYYQQNYQVLDFLEDVLGRVAFKRPRAGASFAEINLHIARVLKEAATVCQEVVHSLDPGSPGGPEITREEYEAIRRAVREAHQELAGLEAAVKERAPAPPSLVARLRTRWRFGGEGEKA